MFSNSTTIPQSFAQILPMFTIKLIEFTKISPLSPLQNSIKYYYLDVHGSVSCTIIL